MITSVAGAAEKTSGTAVRTNADDSVKRADSIRAPKPALSPAPESESSVVEISSEGARRAAQQQAVQTQPRDQAAPPVTSNSKSNVAPIAAPVDQTFNPANEQAPSGTSAAGESSSPSLEAVATSSRGAGSSSATSTQKAASTVKEFDDADTNQDYTVSVLERRAYDFLHPSLNGSSDQDQSVLLASSNEAPKEAQNSRAVDAELKAYTEIAKAGRVA